MLIGLTYDLREDYLADGFSSEAVAEFDSPRTIEAIESSLQELGYQTERIGHAKHLVKQLAQGKRWDLVFNIAEGLYGLGREAQIPCLLDIYNIPYTFSDPMVLSLTLHKGMVKRVVRDLGIPTADFVVVNTIEEILLVDLPLPLFVKPVAEGTGKGITARNLIRSGEELLNRCTELLVEYRQPVLVESYLAGREVTVAILGTGDKARVIGLMEVIFKPNPEGDVYSYQNKAQYEEYIDYRVPEEPVAAITSQIALDSWRKLNCRDAGRVDLRADAEGNWYFMEVNPLAGLHPDHSDLPIIAKMQGITFTEIIGQIINSALQRSIIIQLLPSPRFEPL